MVVKGISYANQCALIVCFAFTATVARVILRELFHDPSKGGSFSELLGPSWRLVYYLYGVALVNFVIRNLFFLPIICTPHVKATDAPLDGSVQVSVIFPAYNEADTIEETCLHALASTSSPNVEFIVVDDRSSDATWEVLTKVKEKTKDSRFKPVAGCERGNVYWRGKNWAVWQGYLRSQGQYLLFCDADLLLFSGAIEAFVTSIQKASVGWISFLPKTRFSSFAEFMFDWPGTVIAQTLLPIQINVFGKIYAFGQCNLFTRDAYEALGGHREIGHLVAESHSLAQLAKTKQIRMRVELAFQYAELTWYHDFWECWKGQLKSVQARMVQKLPIIRRPLPQSVMIVIANIYFLWVAIPSCVVWIQVAKLITALLYSRESWSDYFSKTDLHAGIAAFASVFTVFLKRALGKLVFGYDMRYWWLILTSTVLQMCLGVSACEADAKGRWAVGGQKPVDSVLPKDLLDISGPFSHTTEALPLDDSMHGFIPGTVSAP